MFMQAIREQNGQYGLLKKSTVIATRSSVPSQIYFLSLCYVFEFKPGSVYTDMGLLEFEVQFAEIGKFAVAKKKIALLLELQKKMRLPPELSKKKKRYFPGVLPNTVIC